MSSIPHSEPGEPQVIDWSEQLAKRIAELPPLELPDFTQLSELQLLQYVDEVVPIYSIDKTSTQIIKETMQSVCYARIQELLGTDGQNLERNLTRIGILAQLYGFGKTGVIFTNNFMGYADNFKNSDLQSYIIDFFSKDISEHDWYDFQPILGYIELYQRRLTREL